MIKRIIKTTLILFILTASFNIASSSPVSADIDCAPGFTDGTSNTGQDICVPNTVNSGNCVSAGSFLGLPHWYKYLDCDTEPGLEGTIKVENINGLLPIGFAIAEILLRLTVYAAIIFVVIGGIKVITSAGNAEGLTKARGTLSNALVGLVIGIMATRIVTYIAGTLYFEAARSGGITKFVNFLIQMGAGLAVLFVVVGSFRYITSNGDPQKVTAAKNTVLFALIGLFILISAYTIIGFVVSRI